MDNITQEFIDGLILAIERAEEPESVSNLMVAYVLTFLRDKCLKADDTAGALLLETSNRKSADSLLSKRLDTLNATVFALTEDLKKYRDDFNGLVSGDISAAIDNFNEVIAFLDGLRDDESLAAILTDHAGRLSELGLRVKSAQADANANASAIARHREEAGVYRFDGVFADVGDIPEAALRQGMVVWEGLSGMFRTLADDEANEWQDAGEDFTRQNPDSHDNTDLTIPRTDRLYRAGAELYRVAGSAEEGFRLVRYALVEEVEAIGRRLDTVRESTVDNYQLIKQEKRNREANCDALSDRMAAGFAGVGVYPFAGFVDFGLGEGTDEEGEYAPGAVVFSTRSRCFLCKRSDGAWEHAGAPYDVTDGGHFAPHTDCLYRLGQWLYRAVYSASEGWALVRHLDEQDKLALHPRMTFSDDFLYTGTRLAMAGVTERDIEEWERWSIAGGKVNGGFDRATGTWWLNGVTDIGRDEHDMIMMLAWATRDIASGTHALGAKYALAGKLSTLLCRTLMPISYPDYVNAPSNFICAYNGAIEVLNFAAGDFANIHIHSNPKLRELQGKLSVQLPTANKRACRIEGDSLETVQLVKLAGDLNLGKCPKLSLESVAYIIANRQGTDAITLTLHADVYAALTDEVIDAALKKNVSLAQA